MATPPTIFAGVGSRMPIVTNTVSNAVTANTYFAPLVPNYAYPGQNVTLNNGPIMATNQQIKNAIDLLSTVDERQLEQMEAEFSLAYHKFSAFYERHISKQVAKDNALDWLLATKVPLCPVCGENDRVSLVCPQNDEREYFSAYCHDVVSFSADTSDYSPLNKELIDYITLNAPHLAYLVNDHLNCDRCHKSFDGSTFIKEFWDLNPPFEVITDWVKAGKPGLRTPPEQKNQDEDPDLERDKNGEVVYQIEDDELPF